MTRRELLAERDGFVREMRVLAFSEPGELSGEKLARFNELDAKAEATHAQIVRQEKVDDHERRMNGEPLTGRADTHFESACRDFSLRAAIAGAAGMNMDWSKERELSTELARRSGRSFQGVAVPLSVFP